MDIARFVVFFHGWQPFLLVVVLVLMFINRKRPDYKARGVLICTAAVLVFTLVVGCVQGMRYNALDFLPGNSLLICSQVSPVCNRMKPYNIWPSIPSQYRRNGIKLVNVVYAPPYSARGFVEGSPQFREITEYTRYVAIRSRVEGMAHDLLLFAGRRGDRWVVFTSDMYKPDAIHYGSGIMATICGQSYDIKMGNVKGK
ncbi:MAG: hypothetical protein ACYC1M_17595 [Armatimonadota bacterium]